MQTAIKKFMGWCWFTAKSVANRHFVFLTMLLIFLFIIRPLLSGAHQEQIYLIIELQLKNSLDARFSQRD